MAVTLRWWVIPDGVAEAEKSQVIGAADGVADVGGQSQRGSTERGTAALRGAGQWFGEWFGHRQPGGSPPGRNRAGEPGRRPVAGGRPAERHRIAGRDRAA